MEKNNNKMSKRGEERRGSKRVLSTEFTIGENFMEIVYSFFTGKMVI